MSINSPEDICNMALGRLGITKTITNITTGTTVEEKVCGLWYDISRETTLKQAIPNFALGRVNLAVLDETPAFGWSSAILYPSNCLKVLGIGEVQNKRKNISIENGRIYTELDGDNLELRFIKNIKDVTKFYPDFKMLLSYVLADNICMSITQSLEKANYMSMKAKSELSSSSAMNAQENPPIRINYSRFKASRLGGKTTFTEKL